MSRAEAAPRMWPPPPILRVASLVERGLRMRICLRYFDGCPNWHVARERLRRTLDELGHADVPIELERVETIERAREIGFRGSPTVLVDGEDAVPDERAPVGLMCRIYRTPRGADGAPSMAQLREAIGG